jgi:uncharacterized protein (TIGR01777 family)
MKILLTGATGFIGRSLSVRLFSKGHNLLIIARDFKRAKKEITFPCEIFEWDIEKSLLPPELFKGIDSIIHLAGESISGKRWNKKRKKAIYDSRILSTRNLVQSIRQTEGTHPKSFIVASAIGIFGDRGNEVLLEDSKPGQDFLSRVCIDWEAASHDVRSLTRIVNLRLGVVLGRGGGAMAKMLPSFAAGLGAKLGSGQQWMSWIHIDDVIGAIEFALENTKVAGPINIVSPNPVTNEEFTKELAEVLNGKARLKAPNVMLKIVFGEMASFILGSTRVLPKALQSNGFKFKFPGLKQALTNICNDKVFQ